MKIITISTLILMTTAIAFNANAQTVNPAPDTAGPGCPLTGYAKQNTPPPTQTWYCLCSNGRTTSKGVITQPTNAQCTSNCNANYCVNNP
jgi:hypothetical protein